MSLSDLSKLGAVIGSGVQFLADNGDFAADIDTLLGTSSDEFARSVLGYTIAHGSPTARQIAAIERTAAQVRRRSRQDASAARRSSYVRSHGEASVPVHTMMTVERGLTHQVPADLVPEAAMVIEHTEVIDVPSAEKPAPRNAGRGRDIDNLIAELGL